MRISVTQGHIDKGKPAECRACAIALALQDAGFTNVRASYERLEMGDGRAITPLEVMDFMLDFDAGKKDKCRPFEFDLVGDPQQ